MKQQFFVVLFLVAVVPSLSVKAADPERGFSRQEEDSFWKRFLYLSATSVQPTPTRVPTQRSSIDPEPTPDVAFTTCELDATIFCSTLRNPDASESSCTSLASPSQPTCLPHGRPRRLSWLYNGMPCNSYATKSTNKMFKCTTLNGGPSMNPPDDVFISVVSEDKVYFAGGIRFGSTFSVSAGNYDEAFGAMISIVISQLKDGDPQETLQTIELRTECQIGSGIHVLTQHGAVQLVGFESNEQGLQNALEEVTITYVIQNTGLTHAKVKQISVNSTLTGERDFVPLSGLELQRGESERWVFKTPINLYAADGLDFYNEMYVEGTGLLNNIVCRDKANLDIKIGGE